MEPISYLRAPIRRWPVLIPFVLVAMVVAVLVPVTAPSSPFPNPTWQAPAQVGLSPGGKGNTLGARLGLKQLEFYAHVPAVIDAAATADGVKVTKKLPNDVVIGKAKVSKEAKAAGKAGGGGAKKSGSILQISVLQPSKTKAVSMTNAFVAALGSYAQLQFDEQAKQAAYVQQLYITNLQNALAALPSKSTTPTTIKPATTKHGKVKRVVVRPPVTTTTVKASMGAANQPAQLTAFRATPITPGVVTPTSLPGTPVTLVPGAPVTLVPGAPTTTTTPKISKTEKEERDLLTKELAQAMVKQQALKSRPTPQTGIKVIAAAKSAKN